MKKVVFYFSRVTKEMTRELLPLRPGSIWPGNGRGFNPSTSRVFALEGRYVRSSASILHRSFCLVDLGSLKQLEAYFFKFC